MSKKKSNKITYKTYFNKRLKEMDFHGVKTYPLYIQVTYKRKSIFFKSYYFELLKKPQYLIKVPGQQPKGPEVSECISKEKEVIEFIIEQNKDDFSLELFKSSYLYFSKDLCDVFQSRFIEYLYNFFWDEGNPSIGDLILHGCKNLVVYEVIRSFKRALRPELYQKLLENSLYFSPPYLPVYEFMEAHRWPNKMLRVFEFENPETIKAFQSFLTKKYPTEQVNTILMQVAHWEKYL